MDTYPVPFRVDRSRSPTYVLRNVSSERLRGVTVMLTGRGVMAAPVAVSVDPRQELRLVIRGDDLELDSAAVVRWMTESGDEYLWRFVL